MERRVSKRVTTALATTCRVPAAPYSAKVHNLSAKGCRIGLRDFRPIPSGSTVHIDFGGGRTVSGTAVWSRTLSCGVRFTQELPSELAVEFGLMDASVLVTAQPPGERETGYPDPSIRTPHWLRKRTLLQD